MPTNPHLGGITFVGKSIPGMVLRGMQAVDPQLETAVFHPPGTDGEFEVPIGLTARPILVPMVVCHERFRSYSDIWKFLRDLEEKKSAAQEGKLVIALGPGSETYKNCRYEGFQMDPFGIIGNIGTLPGLFIVGGLFVFKQNRPVE